MNFKLPDESRNHVVKAVKLIRKGFKKWEAMPKTTRNIAAGISFLATGVVLPKVLFMGVMSSFFLGKHLYLNGEVEAAAKEIIVEKDSCGPDCGCKVNDPDKLF